MKPMITLLIPFLLCCNVAETDKQVGPVLSEREARAVKSEETKPIKDPSGTNIQTRYNTPDGFVRVPAGEGSFAHYLRMLPLKVDGEKVKYYNGTFKEALGVYDAVVDMEISNKDLQQCADAIMRLRGEYLFAQKQYDKIHFNLTNGFRMDYAEWMKGKRVEVKGNNTSWVQSAAASNTYKDFRNYMEFVFMYAGTMSLSKELVPVRILEMQVGDVFIIGGSPGHAVLVVDMCENPLTGEKLFMLAQSYMPAQETQILINPVNPETSPWYSLNFTGKLHTPEWLFGPNDLMRFKG